MYSMTVKISQLQSFNKINCKRYRAKVQGHS